MTHAEALYRVRMLQALVERMTPGGPDWDTLTYHDSVALAALRNDAPWLLDLLAALLNKDLAGPAFRLYLSGELSLVTGRIEASKTFAEANRVVDAALAKLVGGQT